MATTYKYERLAKVSELDSYSLLVDAGTTLNLSVDSSTYLITATLSNKEGTILSTSTLDLPLESMVIDASYDSGTLTLTLQNGNSVEVDISDIISGLVPDSRTIAGLDLTDDITASELSSAIVTSGTLSSVVTGTGLIDVSKSNSNLEISIDSNGATQGAKIAYTDSGVSWVAPSNVITLSSVGSTTLTEDVFNSILNEPTGTSFYYSGTYATFVSEESGVIKYQGIESSGSMLEVQVDTTSTDYSITSTESSYLSISGSSITYEEVV